MCCVGLSDSGYDCTLSVGLQSMETMKMIISADIVQVDNETSLSETWAERSKGGHEGL